MKSRGVVFVAGLGIGAVAGIIHEHKRMENILVEQSKKTDTLHRYRAMLLAWIKLDGENRNFEAFFEWYGAKNIAVYGNGQIGKCFINSVKNSRIRVDYIIDRNAACMSGEVPIMTLADELPQVDVIVVTVIDEFDNIEEEIRKKHNYSVVSIEDVVFGSSQ